MDPASASTDLTLENMTQMLQGFRSQLLNDIERLLINAFQRGTLKQSIEESITKTPQRTLSQCDAGFSSYEEEPYQKTSKLFQGLHRLAVQNGVALELPKVTHGCQEASSPEVEQQPPKLVASPEDPNELHNTFAKHESTTISTENVVVCASGAVTQADDFVAQTSGVSTDHTGIVQPIEIESRWLHQHHPKKHYSVRTGPKVVQRPWPAFSLFTKQPVKYFVMLAEKLNCIVSEATVRHEQLVDQPDGSSLAVVTKFVTSTQFTTLAALFVIANAVWTGVVTHYGLQMQYGLAMTGRYEQPFSGWKTFKVTVDVAFICVFVVELALRAYVYRVLFILGSEARWNIFDVFLVGSSLLDLMLTASNFSFIRILRLIRMTKMLRVVRMVSLFKSLRKMVISVCGCLMSLLWLTCLLLIIIYVYAIGFMQIYLQELEAGSLSRNSDTLEKLQFFYGSVGVSMLTLFMAICGGRDWGDAMEPIKAISPMYGFLFLFYIVFVIFGVMNVVTGVFVDKALEITAQDKEFVILEEIENRREDIKQLKEFFYTLDHDGSGVIDKQEMIGSLEDHWLQGSLSSMDIDGHAMVTLFDVIDTDNKGTLTIEEFIQGCMQIRGDAKAVDLFALLVESRSMYRTMAQFMEFCEDRFLEIEQAVVPSHNSVAKRQFSISSFSSQKE